MAKQIKISCNRVYITIATAIFTIVQTIGHMISVSLLVLWTDCNVGDDYNFVMSSLFGKHRCDNGTLNDPLGREENITVPVQFSDILLSYFVLDMLWLVTSAGLLMGACCRMSEIWALAFYLPWAVINAIGLILDAFSAIFFGLNIPKYGTIFDWLSVTGIATNTIHNANNRAKEEMPDFIVGAISIIMTFISARGGIIWIINLVLLVVIVRIAISEYKTKQNCQNCDGSAPERSNSERIRNWYMFYDQNRDNQDSENPNNIIETNNNTRQSARVKMTTLTIISYETFNNAAYASDSDDGISFTEMRPTVTGFKQNFPNIIVTDIASNTSTPSDPQPSRVPWTCNERSGDLEEDGDSQSIANLKNKPLEDFSGDIPRTIVSEIVGNTSTPSDTQSSQKSSFYIDKNATNKLPADEVNTDDNDCQNINIIKLKNVLVKDNMELENDISKA